VLVACLFLCFARYSLCSRRDLHSFPTRRSSDLWAVPVRRAASRLGSESELSAINLGAYCFPTTIYETTSASSARFPCLNVRSRNQSPPWRTTLLWLPHQRNAWGH